MSETDSYLLLLRGIGRSGNVLYRNDDYQGYNSRISETLSAGDYTIEATTYSRGATGSFTLTVAGIDSDTAPTGTPTPVPTATTTPTPVATATPAPTATPVPEATSSPTATPAPGSRNVWLHPDPSTITFDGE